MKLDLTREVEVQRAVIGVYTTFGCEVRRFSEGRRTRVSPGWPDLAVFCTPRRVFWVHEVKVPSGKQSPEQSSTQQLLESCGIRYVCGGVHEAQEQLRTVGLIATRTQEAER